MHCSPPDSSVREIFPSKNTGVGSHFLLQGIFPTHGSNPHLLHWQADSLPLSHQGSPTLEITHTHTHKPHFIVEYFENNESVKKEIKLSYYFSSR